MLLNVGNILITYVFRGVFIVVLYFTVIWGDARLVYLWSAIGTLTQAVNVCIYIYI